MEHDTEGEHNEVSEFSKKISTTESGKTTTRTPALFEKLDRYLLIILTSVIKNLLGSIVHEANATYRTPLRLG